MVEDNLDGGKDVEFSLQCAEFETSVRYPSMDEKWSFEKALHMPKFVYLSGHYPLTSSSKEEL